MNFQEEFQKIDSGAADCIPIQAGSIKKGDYCMINGFPCKISDYSTAKPGKHGSAKATIIGYDIFTDKRHQQIYPTSSNVQVPNVTKVDYKVGNIDDDDFVTIILQDGTLYQNMKLPNDPELNKDLRKIYEENQSENDVYFTVIRAVGQEKFISGKARDN